MFNKFQETRFIFRRKKEGHKEKEAIFKTKNFIETGLIKIILSFNDKLNFAVHNTPVSFAEDENYEYVEVNLKTSIKDSDDILSRLIQEIRDFFINNHALNYKEFKSIKPIDDAIIESKLKSGEHN